MQIIKAAAFAAGFYSYIAILMIVELPYIKEKFREFNEKYFRGELPAVPVVLSNAGSFLGKCEFKGSYRLRFSVRFDLPQEEWDDIIIHEMIHLWIGVKGIKDSSAHGRVFRSIMNEFNTKYGRHISISHKVRPGEQARPARKGRSSHLVALVLMKDGRKGIKIIPQQAHCIRQYYRGLKRSGQVIEVQFYLSTNPYFNAFPSSVALKVYFPPAEEVQSALEGAVKV